MKKKMIYLSVVIAVFLSMNVSPITGSSAGSSKFKDITSHYSWAQEAIDDLCNRGVINGMSETTFAPSDPVTKEQFAKMVVLALDIDLVEGESSAYKDVDNSRWSVDYINTVKNYFYDDSYGSERFNPAENYSREKMCVCFNCRFRHFSR